MRSFFEWNSNEEIHVLNPSNFAIKIMFDLDLQFYYERDISGLYKSVT